MKNLAFGVALVLLALTLTLAIPGSAAETSKAAPAMAVEPPTQGQVPPFELMFRPPLQRCSALQGTSCTTVGSTMPCTDACNDQLSCTCVFFNNMRFWNCSVEC